MRFSKMHGAGNDFVVLDCRVRPLPDAALIRAMADRHAGIGCDQLLTIQRPRSGTAVAAYGIHNADGTPAGQCGNGARCVAAWLRRDNPDIGTAFAIDSPSATHAVEQRQGLWSIDMGQPAFDPALVPMAGGHAEADHYAAALATGLVTFGAVSMGNPHAVLEVDDVAGAEVARIGPALQDCGLFPASVNVGFAQVLGPDRIALRVYERGCGETLACGSGACAAVAVLTRQGRLGAGVPVRVSLPGGELRIEYDADGRIHMAGPAVFVFEGEWW